MGNEFNHPDWVEFPSENNSQSLDKCRRLWWLGDDPKYFFWNLKIFEKMILSLSQKIKEVKGVRNKDREGDYTLVVDIGLYRVVTNVSIFSCFYKEEEGYSLLIDSNNKEYGPCEQPIVIPNTNINNQLNYLAGFSTQIYTKKN